MTHCRLEDWFTLTNYNNTYACVCTHVWPFLLHALFRWIDLTLRDNSVIFFKNPTQAIVILIIFKTIVCSNNFKFWNTYSNLKTNYMYCLFESPDFWWISISPKPHHLKKKSYNWPVKLVLHINCGWERRVKQLSDTTNVKPSVLNHKAKWNQSQGPIKSINFTIHN